ncbi:MAG: ABC transporter permease [bacterium]|nr:ABC transporter permease [bacterium]
MSSLAARTRRSLVPLLGALGLVCLVTASLVGPRLWTVDALWQWPDGLSPWGLPCPPGPDHPMGTDELGRDVLARWLAGSRASLEVGGLATLVAGLVGGAVGLASGLFHRRLDPVLMRVTEVVMAFPTLLLAMGLAAVLPPSRASVVWTLGLTGWPAIARIVRTVTRQLAEQEFLQAAIAMGATHRDLVVRHLLPNLMPTLASLMALKLADMCLLEAALGFLGLGVRPPEPTWGAMIQAGRPYFQQAPWLVAWPGLGLFVLVLSVHMIAERAEARR